jgi:hypothetical protein
MATMEEVRLAREILRDIQPPIGSVSLDLYRIADTGGITPVIRISLRTQELMPPTIHTTVFEALGHAGLSDVPVHYHNPRAFLQSIQHPALTV